MLVAKLISGCGAAGDVSERCRWQIKRGIRSGSNKPIGKRSAQTEVLLQQEAQRMVCTKIISRRLNKDNSISGCGAAGSAGGLGPSGRRFEPCHSDQVGTSFACSDFSILQRHLPRLYNPGIFSCSQTDTNPFFSQGLYLY